MRHRVSRLCLIIAALIFAAATLLIVSVTTRESAFTYESLPEYHDSAMLGNIALEISEYISDLEDKIQEETRKYYDIVERQRQINAEEVGW